MVGLSTNSKVFGGDEKTFEYLAKIGYTDIDFSFAFLYEQGFFDLPDGEFFAYIEKQSEKIRENNLNVYQCHAPYQIPWIGDEKIVAATIKSFRAAAMLGSECMVVHPLSPFSLVDETVEQMEISKKVNREFFEMLLPYAEKYNIKIAVENLFPAGNPASSPVTLKTFIEELDSPLVAACIDVGHAHISKINPSEFIRLLGDKVIALHLHDNQGANFCYDEHYPPFVGSIDWEVVMQSLKDISYKGTLNLESTAFLEQMPKDLKFAAETFAFETISYLAKKYFGEG